MSLTPDHRFVAARAVRAASSPASTAPTDLLDVPQPLGLLPTTWYWRRVEGTAAGMVVLGGVGLLAGFSGGALVGSAAAGGLVAVAVAALLLGLAERAVRRAVRSRRFNSRRPTRALRTAA